MVKFDWEKFKEGKAAVLFTSYKQYKDFAMKAHEEGITWPMRPLLEFEDDPKSLIDASFAKPYGVSFTSGTLGHTPAKYCKDSEFYDVVVNWKDYMRFTKADLQHGDIITTRDGDRLVVFEEFNAALGFILNGAACTRKTQYIDLEDYREDLTCRPCTSGTTTHVNSCDIIKVERPGSSECVFIRDEGPRRVTMSEVCKAFGEEVCIVED